MWASKCSQAEKSRVEHAKVEQCQQRCTWVHAPKVKGVEMSAWVDNLRPGHEVMRSVPWILRQTHPFLLLIGPFCIVVCLRSFVLLSYW